MRLVVTAVLMALEVTLTRLCSVFMPTTVRIGLGWLPIAFIAILFGPLWAGAAYAAGDIIGFLLFPAGPYFPGFTLTAFLTGAVYGLFLHNKPVTYRNTFFAACVIVLGLNLVLDTLWLYILYDQAVAAMMPLRIVKCAITLPLQTFLIPFLWKRCGNQIRQLIG